MAPNDPVNAAVAQLRTARADLVKQLQRIDQALSALGALDVEDKPNISVERTVTDSVTVSDKNFITMVEEVLESSAGPWRGKALSDELVRRFPDHGSPDPYSAVRTALRSLVERGRIVKVDRGLYQAKRWANWQPSLENSESPAEAGLSDLPNESAVAAAGVHAEGGDGSDDDLHGPGHHPASVAG